MDSLRSPWARKGITPGILRIVIAEAEGLGLATWQDAFSQAGVTLPLHYLNSGQDVMNFLNGAQPGEGPASTLVLADLSIPRLSGFELLKLTRADSRLCRIRVVILTSSTESAVIDRAYSLGASGCIQTVQSPKDLKDVVKALVEYWINHNVAPLGD